MSSRAVLGLILNTHRIALVVTVLVLLFGHLLTFTLGRLRRQLACTIACRFSPVKLGTRDLDLRRNLP